MYRVSTGGNYSAVLANIMAAQQRQMDAGNQVATQKKGADLIAHLCTEVESATAAADAAVRDSEAAKQKAEGAEELVSRAEAAAARAESAVEQVISLATSLDLKIKLLFRVMNGELSADQVVKEDTKKGVKVTVADLIEAPVEEEG